MNTTWFEKGEEVGELKGRREALREQLEERFGPLPPQVLENLNRAPAERLTQFAKAVLRANSLRELGLDD